MHQFALLALAACFILVIGQEDLCSLKNGVVYLGDAIPGMDRNLRNAQECCDYCNSIAGCEVFTFYKNTYHCVPKTNRGGSDTSSQEPVVSGNRRTVPPGPPCGNGVVEPGEDCDPGLGPCCTSECKFHHNHHICRPSDNECDPPDHCTGDSAACPTTWLEDGTYCGPEEGYQCFRGVCAFNKRSPNYPKTIAPDDGLVHVHWHSHAKKSGGLFCSTI